MVRLYLTNPKAYRVAATYMKRVEENSPSSYLKLLAKTESNARIALLVSLDDNRSFAYPWDVRRTDDMQYFSQYYPNGREALAEEMFKRGKQEGEPITNGYWFPLARETSSKVSGKIAQYIMGDVSKLSIQEKAKRLIFAGKDISDQKQRQAYVNELLAEGKRLAVIPDKPGEKTYENRTSEIRETLVVLMGQEGAE